MSPDDRLYDVLSRSADTVSADVEGALARVVETNRRRQRTRHTVWAGLGVVLAVGAGLGVYRASGDSVGQAPGPAHHGTSVDTRSPHLGQPGADTALIGEWQSGSTPTADARAALLEAGFDPGMADQVLGTQGDWAVQLTFSTTAFVETWDPAAPAASLRRSPAFGFHLQGADRVVFTQGPSGSAWTFEYRVTADELHLHLVAQPSGATQGLTTARLLACTSVPLTLVR